ncbi:MAG: hypothetical protein ABSB13_09370 [Candidatus Binatus sp.]|jgi:hypothetical protein|uniref:hypothetical protein n=1 Tax=Candidatus Binatus sp. TaxID=2811406 RepID=UPI003D0D4B9C
MPIVGFNQTWVAIALRCLQSGGAPPAGTDQLVLIPSTVLTQSPAPQNLGQTQKADAFFNARPSRDISGIAAQPLFLVAPEVTASAPPYVLVTSIDASGNFVNPGPGNTPVNSPGNGVMGTSGSFTSAEHDTCGPGAACEVSLQDDRITSAVVQTGNDGKHYLLTSFHAGDSTNNTVQSLYFVGQIESFATGSQWNGWYIDGPNFWAGYPTITMDDDLDIAFTFQSFFLNSNIYPNWYIAKGFVPNNNNFAPNPPLLGYGILGNASRAAYYGDTNCPPAELSQRWGDYMSTMWDPNLGSPNESSGFWTVQEYSNGGPTPTAAATPLGSNQSTQITKLADPLPYFVGYNVPSPPAGQGPAGGGENECPNGTGYNCNLTYSAPSGAQFGDVFVVVQYIGDAQNDTYLTLPSGWTLLKFQGGSHTLYSTDGTFTTSYYVALYVYGSQPNDTGQYEFKIVPQANGPETLGFLVAYRGASTNIPGNYRLYGRASTSDSSKVVSPTLSPSNKDSPPAETTLLNVFSAGCIGYDDPDVFGTFGSPSGSPFATVETPLNSVDGFFAADVLVTTSGGTFGPYKSTIGCTTGTGLNTGISLVIPE